ncbi:ROK family protein [Rhizobium laguerreae]|uniref:ROK family protein n=1 Tax=Rhizobium laguerreae TaxID=1076926 RepID=UPI0014415BBB|nr:ROK family protein [Rhizobium laguerreae]MBY3280331.1 ROK family protein [Rhizobium laguerreae]NKM38570.1 ROK family protein [Rhizobium laguerreae]NNH85890.1 ROK family protein [Rhizobium laguerreae]
MQQIAIGIDLGGTQARGALVDERGNVIARREERTDAHGGPDRILSQIHGLVDALLATSDPSSVVGMGVSAPGPIDTVAGVARNIPTLSGFADFPLRAELQKRFLFPVSLENDGIAAAIGEWQFGAGKGVDNLIYVTVSTGIGGGAITDGRVLRGRHGMAAHIGHMSVMPNGEPCPCGNRGCFEAYGSGTAFTRRARARAMACSETTLGANGIEIHSRDVFAAARNGDDLSNRLIDEEAEILGRGFTSLIHIFSPDVVVMGGGLSNEFERLQPGIQRYINEWAMPGFKDVEVVRADLGHNSGLIGSAALAFLSQENGRLDTPSKLIGRGHKG